MSIRCSSGNSRDLSSAYYECKQEQLLFLIWGGGVISTRSMCPQVDSDAMRKNAVCSTAVGCLSAGILITSVLSFEHASLWWLDATIGLIVTVVLMFFGLQTLCVEPWWRKDFWWGEG
jgi:hypothetical protein